jgi:hypothetical protein
MLADCNFSDLSAFAACAQLDTNKYDYQFLERVTSQIVTRLPEAQG